MSQDGHAAAAAAAPSAGDMDAYKAYWAAYGYDVNSPEFIAWQQQQYAQYYAQQGYAGATAGSPLAPGTQPPGDGAAPPPPPPA